ncbi:MAG: hypothetical protein DMG27_14150 [Acidobacteria bacterium]|nr:MAG: hypothetical protein DMG27_14150 [Acidobacteriota bacterium]
MTIEDGFAQTERRIENCGKGTGYKTTSADLQERMNQPLALESRAARLCRLAVMSARRAKKGF